MEETSAQKPNRRELLIAGGVSIAAAGLGAGYLASSASASTTAGSAHTPTPTIPTPTSKLCLPLSKETIEGPYYLDYDKYRSDITEHKPGVPLLLRIRIVDSENCRPLRNKAVDIWHCDALGIYSSYEKSSSGDGPGFPTAFPTAFPTDAPTGFPTAFPTGGPGGGMHAEPDSSTTYFRGFQMTDRNGWVTFRSAFPGWYIGRAIHIHVKVHVNGVFRHGAYLGGNDCHTGQLYFPEKLIEAVSALRPYSTNTKPRTTNAQDMLYTGDTAADGMLSVQYDRRHVARGISASITLGVDPDAVHDGQDWPGGPFPPFPTAPPGTPTPTPSPSPGS
ncbi:dioxygenase family protein [Streptosporangium saharense]|uniref:Protocatechuate 3,4-dioxygenase beta subunit n=1 Tax=Streptosporangium saharense TaxID=1706840 RepID=A0A7W7QSC0_9ACTN|nr:hypothetical protein [Streptosporangium saharense]MBB4918683.1 protocatechuate 3,4-dioxygenase beta subunit [Streptosporangium saharense]